MSNLKNSFSEDSSLESGGSILVVDNEEPIVRNLLQLLTNNGFQPYTAKSGDEALAGQVAIAMMNCRLSESIRNNYFSTLKALAIAIEAKDPYTHGHSEQVMCYGIDIAESMKLTDQEKLDIRFAGLMHDIGKIGIPDYILNKPGSLSAQEFAEIKKHPRMGGRIVGDIPALQRLIPIIEGHHERFDGSGYPYGLKGNAIPLGARILAVADVFEALTSDRPYRKKWTGLKARKEIEKGINTQFDPTVVDVFLRRFTESKLGRS